MAPQKIRDGIEGSSSKSSHQQKEEALKPLTPYKESELGFKTLPKKQQRKLASIMMMM